MRVLDGQLIYVLTHNLRTVGNNFAACVMSFVAVQIRVTQKANPLRFCVVLTKIGPGNGTAFWVRNCGLSNAYRVPDFYTKSSEIFVNLCRFFKP